MLTHHDYSVKLFFFFFYSALLFSSCMTTTYTVQVPYEVSKQVPRTKYRDELRTRTIYVDSLIYREEVGLVPPFFPYKRTNLTKITVLPFSASTLSKGPSAGVEIAEEIEYELIKQIQKYQSKDLERIKTEILKFADTDRYIGINEEQIHKWFRKNRRPLYDVVNRTELGMIIKEADLTSENYINKLRQKIVPIDGLIIGHVKELSPHSTSFIMKCVDIRTSRIIFTQRFEGEYNSCIDKCVEGFFFNIERTGNIIEEHKKVPREETYTERVPDTIWETEYETKYRDEERTRTDYTLIYLFWLGAGTWLIIEMAKGA